jgi:hypothetical protein
MHKAVVMATEAKIKRQGRMVQPNRLGYGVWYNEKVEA